MLPDLKTIIDNFELLEDWEDRYRYVIELGKMLPPLPDAEKTEDNRVRGCASQVWVVTDIGRGPSARSDAAQSDTAQSDAAQNDNAQNDNAEPHLTFRGDSDAHIVKGLVALILTIYSGHTPREILGIDALKIFTALGMSEHLTPQRSNGVRSMVERIRRDAAGMV